MLVLKVGRGFELDVQFWSSVYLRWGTLSGSGIGTVFRAVAPTKDL